MPTRARPWSGSSSSSTSTGSGAGSTGAEPRALSSRRRVAVAWIFLLRFAWLLFKIRVVFMYRVVECKKTRILGLLPLRRASWPSSQFPQPWRVTRTALRRGRGLPPRTATDKHHRGGLIHFNWFQVGRKSVLVQLRSNYLQRKLEGLRSLGIPLGRSLLLGHPGRLET